jgi:hypothetical protein
MAFSAPQKAAIRYRMGWPARFFQTENTLEQSMVAVGNDADASATVIAILAELDDVDAQLVDARKRIKVMKTGTTELMGYGEIAILRAEGRRLVGRLASNLGAPVKADIYAGASMRSSTLLLG